MDHDSFDGIRITSILGTARPGSKTGKALALVADEFDRAPEIEHQLIDLGSLELPIAGRGKAAAPLLAAVERVRSSHGVVIATPEYHGSFAGALKLFIENLGFPSALSTKPVALLGVAAGRIGAIKSLEHLRSVCSHVGAIVLPGPVSVAGVRGVFDAEGHCTDPVVEKHIRGLSRHLLDYVQKAVCPLASIEAAVRGG